MATPHAPASSARRTSNLIAFSVLVAGVGLSVLGWWLLQREAHKKEVLRFSQLQERVVSTVRSRFDEVVRVVEHGRAFVEGRDVGPAEWRRFHGAVATHAPTGLVGIGYIEYVPRDEIPSLERRMSERYGKPFAVQAGGIGPMAYVVTLLEPMRENYVAIGKDLATGKARRVVADEAMATGKLVITRRTFVAFRDQMLPGFLAFSPVYRSGLPVADAEQRSKAIRGWVYVSLQMAPLLGGLSEITDGQLDYAFYEGTGISAENLVFDSATPLSLSPSSQPVGNAAPGRSGADVMTVQQSASPAHSVPLELLGRNWTLTLKPRPEFERQSFDATPVFVLAGGILLSALSASLAWSLVGSRDRALQAAAEMTEGLRRSERQSRRLALIADRTIQGVVLSDLARGTEWVNEGFTRITGYTIEDMAGRRPSEVLAGKGTDWAEVTRMRNSMVEGKVYDGEFLVYKKSGEELWLRVEMQPLGADASDGGATYMALLSDITPRVRNEQMLRKAKEEADRANKAKSTFLAVMSHEIRTPLNGVIGMTSVLADTKLDAEQREFVEVIRSSGGALLSLINDILDFSKIESGHLELEHIPFSPRIVLGEVVELLAPRADEKHLDLLFEVDESVPHTVRSDPTRFRQVLNNLVGNAIKFTEHGEVDVRMRAECGPDGKGSLVVSVRDTGVGISEEARGRLFQAFSQADASTTRRFGGTGLGLAISRRLVEHLGGQLGVQSTIGEGSIFTFSIAIEAAGSAPEPDPLPLRGRRLLVVEDNDHQRGILTHLGESLGMHVEAAPCAVEAMQMAGVGMPFDAILIDTFLPDMEGPSLARELRRTPSHAATPFLLLASHARPLALEEQGLFAAQMYKPGRPGQLRHLLERLLLQNSGVGGGELATVREEAPLRPERVLLAEDDPVHQRVTQHLLRRLGYGVELACDGREALELCERRDFDVILLDIEMPEVNGLQVAAKLRAEPRSARMRPWIIALTANALQEDRRRTQDAGMDDHLGKPVVEAELAAALARAQQARLSPA